MAAPTRLHHLLDQRLAAGADAPALIDHDGRRFSVGALAEAVDAAVRLLDDAAVRAGDRVLILNETCAAAVALVLACSRRGAWAVPVSARLVAFEIDRILGHCAPRAVVYTHEASTAAGEHGARHGAESRADPALGRVLVLGGLSATPEPVPEDGDDDAVAAILYTSGTIGRPKGVVLSHRSLLYVARATAARRHLGPADRIYAVLPFAHAFGLAATVLAGLGAGAELQLVPSSDPLHLATALAKGVTVLHGVPALYSRLLDWRRDHPEVDWRTPALRLVATGGAPLDVALKRRVEALFGLPLHNGYGLTETGPTVAQTLPEAPRADDSVGPLLPGVEAQVVDALDQPLSANEVGELWLRGPGVMRGYYRDEPATRQVLREDGWLRTGDLARFDDSGALFLAGRVKELILRGGFAVYPPEVEAALNAHPLVVQAAVVGHKAAGDELVIAFVQLIPGASVDERSLQNFVFDRLAPFKRPARIFMVDAMPLGPTGKVQKHRLAATTQALCGDDAEGLGGRGRQVFFTADGTLDEDGRLLTATWLGNAGYDRAAINKQ